MMQFSPNLQFFFFLMSSLRTFDLFCIIPTLFIQLFSIIPCKTEFMTSYRAKTENFIGCMFIRALTGVMFEDLLLLYVPYVICRGILINLIHFKKFLVCGGGWQHVANIWLALSPDLSLSLT